MSRTRQTVAVMNPTKHALSRKHAELTVVRCHLIPRQPCSSIPGADKPQHMSDLQSNKRQIYSRRTTGVHLFVPIGNISVGVLVCAGDTLRSKRRAKERERTERKTLRGVDQHAQRLAQKEKRGGSGNMDQEECIPLSRGSEDELPPAEQTCLCPPVCAKPDLEYLFFLARLHRFMETRLDIFVQKWQLRSR